mmetsp:Transcript_10914/g.33710  ORF Transcript_10914/g.33710 Transcript_10914/m.33710 type:complete len:371 (+) Transcript_10914:62-1174(+)
MPALAGFADAKKAPDAGFAPAKRTPVPAVATPTSGPLAATEAERPGEEPTTGEEPTKRTLKDCLGALPSELMRHLAGYAGSPDVVVACGRDEQMRQTLRDGVDDAERARTFGCGLTVKEALATLEAKTGGHYELCTPVPLKLPDIPPTASREGLGRLLHSLTCPYNSGIASWPTERAYPWPLGLMKLLLACGADPNAQDPETMRKDTGFLQERLAPGIAEDRARRITFLTRLIIEVEMSRGETVELARLALDAGANANKCSPLYYAIAANCYRQPPEKMVARFEIASMLIERGANVQQAERWWKGINHSVNKKYNDPRLPDSEFSCFLWPQHWSEFGPDVVRAVERLHWQIRAKNVPDSHLLLGMDAMYF